MRGKKSSRQESLRFRAFSNGPKDELATTAERALLGAVLQKAKNYWEAASILGDLPLLTPSMQDIWMVMGELARAGTAIDAVTLKARIGDEVLPVVASLAMEVPSSESVRDYALIVRDRSMRRQIRHVLAESQAALNNLDTEADAIHAEIHQELLSAARHGGRTVFEEASSIATEIALGKRKPLNATPTRWKAIDEMLAGGGLVDNDLVIIAGRPSMGKTAFGMQMAFRVALEAHAPAAVFSYEMSTEALVLRLLSGLSKIPHSVIRRGKIPEKDKARLRDAVVEMEKGRLLLTEAIGLSATGLQSQCRTLAAMHGRLSCVVVDYLQLMPTARNAETRDESVAANAKALKQIAKELKCPVIGLSQLNRQVEQRPDKRPTLGDLRESGAIEQVADVVIGLFREGYYERPKQDSGVAEALFMKQRNGATGSAFLHFTGATVSFDELRRKEEPVRRKEAEGLETRSLSSPGRL